MKRNNRAVGTWKIIPLCCLRSLCSEPNRRTFGVEVSPLGLKDFLFKGVNQFFELVLSLIMF